MSINTFAALKKSRTAILNRNQAEAKKVQNPSFGNNDDVRQWKPELDKLGNGYAEIRFLPSPKNEDFPWVQVYSHGFKGPGGWYIENSLTTLKQKDPVGEANSALWATGTDANKEIARQRKRRTQYISNILIIKDPKHPENDGQVKLFKYGKKIWDKISDKLTPQFEGETPVDPFDPWGGANFKLKVIKKDGYPNYDKSEFEPPAPLFDGDDDKIEELWHKEFSLREFIDAKNFKPYDELKAKFERVVNGTGSINSRQAASAEDDFNAPAAPVAAPPVQRHQAPPAAPTAPAANAAEDKAPWEEDDTDALFEKLTAE